MLSNDPLAGLEVPDGVRLVQLPPVNRRLKNPPPEWAVRLGSAQFGRIEQWRVHSATATFYSATAIHPVSGESNPLESGTDLTERVAKVLSAWRDPDSFVRRYSWERSAS